MDDVETRRANLEAEVGRLCDPVAIRPRVAGALTYAR